MDKNFGAYLIEQGSKLGSDLLKIVVLRSSKKAAAPEPSSPVKEEEARTPATTAPPSALSDRRGTGCRPCTSDHFSTCAGALAEALRFARVDGIEDQQVQDRIALCVEELNIWERVDAAADKLPSLAAPEREFVRRWLPKGRGLRHDLNEIETLENLEATAALARQQSREARKEMRELRPPVMSKIESLAQKVKTGEISNKKALGELTDWWREAPGQGNPMPNPGEKTTPEASLQSRVYYHGLPSQDVPLVLKEGLKVEKTPMKRIFLTRTAHYAADYGDAILEVRLPRGFPISHSQAGEYVTFIDIPPESLAVGEKHLKAL